MVKPLAPVGKQVRCAVAPKTFMPLGTHYTYFVSVGHKGDKEICERASHTSAHDGSCALSDESVASAKPRLSEEQRTHVTWIPNSDWLK